MPWQPFWLKPFRSRQQACAEHLCALLARMPLKMCWKPSDPSLARESFNAMVSRKELDVTEVMMKHSSMGQKAMQGPGWIPSGMVSRQIASLLTAEKEGTDIFAVLQEKHANALGNGFRRPPSNTSSQRSALVQSRSSPALQAPRLLPPLNETPSEKVNWAEVAGIMRPKKGGLGL